MVQFKSFTVRFMAAGAVLIGLAAWLAAGRLGFNPYAVARDPIPAYASLRRDASPGISSPLATPTASGPGQAVGTKGESGHAAVASPTSTPAVVIAHEPSGNHVRSNSDITLTFNCPMEPASVEQRFALRRADLPANAASEAVPGRFSWPAPDVLIFTPKTLLVDGASYSITLEEGAQARLGGTPTRREYIYTFSVLPLPAITRSSPRDGDVQAKLGDRVTLYFNLPMRTETVEQALRISPEPAEPPRFEWNKAGTTLDIVFEIDPSALYTILLSNEAVDAWGRALRDNRSIAFQTAPMEAVVWLVGPRGYWNNVYGTYNPNPQVRQYTQFRNVEKLSYRLSQVARQDFLALFQPAWRDNKKPPSSTLVYSWVQTVTAPLNKLGLDLAHISLPDGSPLPSGAYLLEVEGLPGKAHDWRMLIVTGLNLALKRSDKQTFVWATDLRTGQPVSGLQLSVYDMDKTLIVQGETNDVGVFKTDQAPKCLDRWECAYGWRPLYVVAEGEGEQWGFVASTWDEGIAMRDFRMPYYYGEPSHTIFLYTDRPLYRPGQSVYFKGVVRQDNDGRYRLPQFSRLPVVINDAAGNEIYRQSLPLSDVGTFHGEITLSEEAALGLYSVNVAYATDESPAYGNFRVAEYRKPEFKVSVTPAITQPLHGEIITVTVQADYYFGAPLAGAEVEWRMYSDDYQFSLPNEWYSFSEVDETYWYWGGEQNGGQNIYANGRGRTDARGTFTFSLPLDLSKSKRSQTLTFEADVVDQNQQVTSARGYAVAHKSRLYIGARPRWYVTKPKEFLDIQLVAAAPDKTVLPGIPLTVELYEREWRSVRIRDEYGTYNWQSNYEDELISTQVVTTGADGRVVAIVTPPKGGEYRVVARWQGSTGTVEEQAQGSTIESASASTFFWTWGGEYVNWGIQNDDRINIIADKRLYQPGDTARLLVTAPFADSLALVSVERGGVLRYWTLPIKSTSALIEVPIHADYAPNAFVSVILLKGQAEDFPTADFKIGYAALNVEPVQQRLKVELIPDRTRYTPRATATYTVRVSDYQGKPVDAEVSLSLVDAAVLALVGDQDPDILAAFYRQRGLGVHNSLSLVTSVDRLSAVLDKQAKGGGGGDGIDVREHFADTAFWRADVRTGPGGEVAIQVPLPDNLTTWRMRAKAVSASTQLGQAEVDVIATKDILLRPVLPRFFTAGDQARVGTIVHNDTPLTETLRVECEIQPRADDKMQTACGEAQEVTIGPNGSMPAYWDVSIPRTLSVTLLMRAATLDQRGDAVKLVLPVDAYFDSIAYSTYRSITGTATISVALPVDVERDMDELVIEVEPTLAASIDSGLEYLVGFPYGCVEQTMSSFLPDVVVMRMIEEIGLNTRPGFRDQLGGMIESGMQRLYGYQHNDGGWGWWKDDASNPSITAYVLYGLHQMELGGRAIDADVRDAAVGYMLAWLQRSAVDDPIGPVHGAERVASGANVRAYALYVLAELGHANPGLAGRLYEQRDKLDHYGKAYLALALYLGNEQRVDERVETLMQELREAAKQESGAVYWEDKQNDIWGMSTGVRTTAVALDAFVQLFISDPTIDPAARWLLTQRQESHWGTTQETSMSLVALIEYLSATFEREGNYTYTVRVNGQEIATMAVTPQTLGKHGKWAIPLSELATGDPVVEIVRDQGPGAPLRANVSLRHYRSGDGIAPIQDRGVQVKREYATLDGRPLEELQLGDVVALTLTVKVDSSLTYVLVEDRLPAGLEPIDTSLATTSQQFKGKRGDWVWSRVELRDDRVALFANWLPAGRAQIYTYLARVTTAGTFYALPLQAYAMYKPDTLGRTAGTVIAIDSAE
jgi:uncharacterized protein YfaS (alpha-2-macroglobulin family)